MTAAAEAGCPLCMSLLSSFRYHIRAKKENSTGSFIAPNQPYDKWRLVKDLGGFDWYTDNRGPGHVHRANIRHIEFSVDSTNHVLFSVETGRYEKTFAICPM